MRSVRPRKVKIILVAALCGSDAFKWATLSREELPRGPEGTEYTWGQERVSGEWRGSQGNFSSRVRQWAEAKAYPAAGVLAVLMLGGGTGAEMERSVY